jgi:predicted acylesterase/phospholipase RssA
LLRQLRERKIPIDLVSGTSFGALVGAYYCAQGVDGLETLVEQAMLYTGVVSLTVFSSALLEHLVNLSIEYRPMWELPIPFYAVATDVEKGEPAIFPGPLAANPSVGFAVRASGALPGVFSPALAGDTRPTRYVDGGAVSIVPTAALLQFGADVIIGANAFPFRKNDNTYSRSPLTAFLPPPFNRMARQFLEEMSPGNRMIDAARTLSLTLTTAMQQECDIASAVYEHKRTDVKYWEFHRARRVLADATEDLATSGALPAAINAVRNLNLPTS